MDRHAFDQEFVDRHSRRKAERERLLQVAFDLRAAAASADDPERLHELADRFGALADELGRQLALRPALAGAVN